jgi:hypothetical protein
MLSLDVLELRISIATTLAFGARCSKSLHFLICFLKDEYRCCHTAEADSGQLMREIQVAVAVLRQLAASLPPAHHMTY